jgi:hypothetical protein
MPPKTTRDYLLDESITQLPEVFDILRENELMGHVKFHKMVNGENKFLMSFNDVDELPELDHVLDTELKRKGIYLLPFPKIGELEVKKIAGDLEQIFERHDPTAGVFDTAARLQSGSSTLGLKSTRAIGNAMYALDLGVVHAFPAKAFKDTYIAVKIHPNALFGIVNIPYGTFEVSREREDAVTQVVRSARTDRELVKWE